jgi:hypothetical protein
VAAASRRVRRGKIMRKDVGSAETSTFVSSARRRVVYTAETTRREEWTRTVNMRCEARPWPVENCANNMSKSSMDVCVGNVPRRTSGCCPSFITSELHTMERIVQRIMGSTPRRRCIEKRTYYAITLQNTTEFHSRRMRAAVRAPTSQPR